MVVCLLGCLHKVSSLITQLHHSSLNQYPHLICNISANWSLNRTIKSLLAILESYFKQSSWRNSHRLWAPEGRDQARLVFVHLAQDLPRAGIQQMFPEQNCQSPNGKSEDRHFLFYFLFFLLKWLPQIEMNLALCRIYTLNLPNADQFLTGHLVADHRLNPICFWTSWIKFSLLLSCKKEMHR